MSLIATPAGQTPAKAEKLANEIITYTLDCSKLLDKFELISSANIQEQKGISFSSTRTRKGTSVEFKVANDSIITAAYVDFNIKVELNTSFNNKRIAVVQLRVHKWYRYYGLKAL